MKPNSAPPEQRPSAMLSKEENEAVFRLLGNRCQALSTTVIQLFTTDSPSDNEWHKRYFGILCLVKDNPRRSYFFRLYCLTRRQLVWEHELYKGMNYMAPQEFLHIFEAEDCIVAFNFANENEAKHMRHFILEKQKRLERRRRAQTQPRPTYEREKRPVPQPPVTNGMQQSDFHQTHRSLSSGDKTKKRKKGNKLTKEDISSPSHFRHVSHVGWDATKGFDYNECPELEPFFKRAGVSQRQLEDPSTREFIYDFINQRGGIGAILKGEPKSEPPPVPERHLPPPPPLQHQKNIPPPPPPIGTMPSRPQPPSIHNNIVPPPPPPNPPPLSNIPSQSQGFSSPAPPPPPPPSQAIPVDTRSALMDSIRSGAATLKKVDPDTKVDHPIIKNDDPRDAMLNQIKEGIKLKPVEPNKDKPQTSAPGKDSLADTLRVALERRFECIQDSSDSSDTNEEDDDEWD